jgi:aspartyl-tRNA synthetase
LGYIFWRDPQQDEISERLKSADELAQIFEQRGDLAKAEDMRAAKKRVEAELAAHKFKLEEAPTAFLSAAGPIAKALGAVRTLDIREQLGLGKNDAVFFTAGDPAKFYKFAGSARDRVGTELKLIDESRFALAWIVDFPFYEWNEDDKKIDFSHNPFSMPKGGREALEAAEKQGRDALLALKANQYDIVCNGFEIASGSVRNHVPETMVKAFEITGLSQADVESRFGGLYRAFQYGAPPHGGMAAGIDRMVMLLVGAKNLREISLFPMNQQANDLLMGAPSEVLPKQLRELSLRVMLPEAKKV